MVTPPALAEVPAGFDCFLVYWVDEWSFFPAHYSMRHFRIYETFRADTCTDADYKNQTTQ